MEIGGMVKTEDFARWICATYRMDRVIVETSEAYVRPNMFVIVRRVPRYYRIIPPPKKPVSVPVEKKECYDIENEFGPDPMSKRPDTRVWRRPTKRVVQFIPSDAFAIENMVY
jgi:hypothetical protein